MNFVKNNSVNFGSKVINNYLTGNLQGTNAVSEDFNNWNILDENGQRVLTFDSFIKSSVNSESKVTQMPVEKGSFVDYNIVKTPLNMSVTLVKSGSSDELSEYVNTLLELVDSTKLVTVITPEKEYNNMKIVKVNFDRSTDNGVNIILAECNFLEIRQVQSKYGNARLQGKTSRGLQQPKANKETSGLKGILGYIS